MDLTTRYLGLSLRNPFLTGAGPLTDSLDTARRLEDAGASALVMRSLFEEQLVREELHTHGAFEDAAHSTGEAESFLPDPDEFVLGPHEYLENLRILKENVDIPVIPSLNGTSLGSWLRNAKLLEQAGADALELNLFTVPDDPGIPAEAIEDEAVDMVREIRAATKLPIALKLSPFYSSLAHFVSRLTEAGADGVVLFNRFFEPDVDIDELEVRSTLRGSTSAELLLRLRWLAILSHAVPGTTFAVTGGVHHTEDAIKALMCGAHAIQLVSSVLRHGPESLAQQLRLLEAWMEEKEYASIDEMRGCMNLGRCPDPKGFLRGNYIRLLQTWEHSG